MKKPVTTSALIKRLNRYLPKSGMKLFQCKINSRGYRELGDYYIVDTGFNVVSAKYVDIEKFARKEGVLKDYEEVVL